MRIITTIKLALATMLLAVGVGLSVQSPVFAQKEEVCQGARLAGSDCTGGDAEISGLIKTTINILSLIGGIAAVIVIIISGLRIITSNGSSDGLAAGRNGVIFAIIGLIVVIFAQVIVRFVLGRVG